MSLSVDSVVFHHPSLSIGTVKAIVGDRAWVMEDCGLDHIWKLKNLDVVKTVEAKRAESWGPKGGVLLINGIAKMHCLREIVEARRGEINAYRNRGLSTLSDDALIAAYESHMHHHEMAAERTVLFEEELDRRENSGQSE